MKKPIGNFYTIIWVDVPDEDERTPRRGIIDPGAFVVAKLIDVKNAIARRWRDHKLAGGKLAGGLAGALATLALVFTRG
jgi:hypothetical protein